MNFIIAAPPYTHRSGGIMVLHALCTALNLLHHKAGIAIITEGSHKIQGFKFGFSSEKMFLDPHGMYYDYFTNKSNEEINDYVRNACAIYPNIIKGNPLNSKNYITYVLGPDCHMESEFILGFSRVFHANPDFILHKSFLSEHMHDDNTRHWTQRDLFLTYIGKGSDYTQCHIIPNTVLIERDWPRDKTQLSLLLRNCKYFFTWDSLSATNADAVLCGAVPILMQDKQIKKEDLDQLETGPLPPIQYDPTMPLGSNPTNMAAIDDAMSYMKKTLRHLDKSWLCNVEEFIRFYSQFKPR